MKQKSYKFAYVLVFFCIFATYLGLLYYEQNKSSETESLVTRYSLLVTDKYEKIQRVWRTKFVRREQKNVRGVGRKGFVPQECC